MYIQVPTSWIILLISHAQILSISKRGSGLSQWISWAFLGQQIKLPIRFLVGDDSIIKVREYFEYRDDHGIIMLILQITVSVSI